MLSGRAQMRPFVVKMEDAVGHVKREEEANVEQPWHRRRLNEGGAALSHGLQSLRAHAEAQVLVIQSMEQELQHAKQRITELTAEAKIKDEARFKDEPMLASIDTKGDQLQRKDAEVRRVHAYVTQGNSVSAAVGDARQPAPAGGGAAAPPRNGQGKYTWDDGSMYVGEWANGESHGRGKLTFSNGNVYEGEFEDGEAHGQGSLMYADGDVYEGDFEDGSSHGTGKLRFTNGDIYDGEFASDQRHGRGKMTYADGNVYEGEFRNCKAHGKGTLTKANGDIYKGQWQNEMMHGKGKYTKANGDVYAGQWQYHKFLD